MYTAIIPARKGSKRLPGKNIKLLLGKPMIEYTIEAAIKSKHIDRIIISTDIEEVESLKEKYSNIIFDKRPPEYAIDTTTAQEVVNYLVQKYDLKNDNIVWLQPTSPTRTSDEIDKAIKWFEIGGFETLVTVRFLSPFQLFLPEGTAYIFKNGKIWNKKIGVHVLDKPVVDVDTEFDFKMAEMVLNGNTNNNS